MKEIPTIEDVAYKWYLKYLDENKVSDIRPTKEQLIATNAMKYHIAAMTEWASLNRQGWMRVEDGLPEASGENFTIDVLAFGDNGITVSSLYKSYNQITGYGRNECGYNRNVTHWMPLPTKPNL